MRSEQVPDQGGGAALTREKIIAEASERFICIVDPSKQVPVLGNLPKSPMSRYQPTWREGVVTDNGNQILDIHNLQITDPEKLERELNQLPGGLRGPVRAPPRRW